MARVAAAFGALLGLFATLALSQGATAQAYPQNFKIDGDTSCDRVSAESERLNGVELLQAAAVCHAAGRHGATGGFRLYKLSLNRIYDRVAISLKTGVIDTDCEFPRTTSYPFVVYLTDKTIPEGGFANRSNTRGVFHDDCKRPLSGEPNAWRRPLK